MTWRPAMLAAKPSPNGELPATALQMRGMRERLRDTVCVGPRYPGGPSNYRYTLRETCTPIKRALAAKPKPKTTLTAAATLKEIAQIRRVLEVQYGAGEPKGERKRVPPYVLQEQFSSMIAPFYRLKYPDPEVRYTKILAAYEKQPPPTRYRVMYLTLTHLEALLAADTSKSLPGMGAVSHPDDGPAA